MTPDRLSEIEIRLQHLERRCRFLLGIAGVASVALTALVLTAARSAGDAADARTVEEVRAHKFVLVDEAGQVRGYWGLGRDGSALLSQRGSAKDDSPMLGLTADEKGVGVILTGSDQNEISMSARSALGSVEDVKLLNPKIKEAARTRGHSPEQYVPGALLSVGNPDRGVTMKSCSGGESTVSANWSDRRASLTSSADASDLMLGRGDGTCVSAVVDRAGPPSVSLWSGTTQRAVLGGATLTLPATGGAESRSASSLVLFGPDGRSILKLP